MKEKVRTVTQAKKMASSPDSFSTPEDGFGELWNSRSPKKLLQSTEPGHVSSYAGGRAQRIKDNAEGNIAVKLIEVVPMAADELFVHAKRFGQVRLSAQDADANNEVDVPWITINSTKEGLPREIPQDNYHVGILRELSAGFNINSSIFLSSADHRSSCGLRREVKRSSDSEHGQRVEKVAAVGICNRPQDFSHHHCLLNSTITVPEHCKPKANTTTGQRRPQHQQQRSLSYPTSPCWAPSSRGVPSGGGAAGGGLINFSHFMRPFAPVKASPEVSRAAGGKLLSGHETTSSCKPRDSTLVDSGSAFKCISTTPAPLMADAKPEARPPHQEATIANFDKSDNSCLEAHPNTKMKDKAKGAKYAPDPSRMPSNSSFAASVALSRHEMKKPSAVEASSSSSGNSHGKASNHFERRKKRKHHKEEEEDESGHFRRSDHKEFSGNPKRARDRGTKKRIHQRSSGIKRRCAADVHKMSERRRSDRINQRMRALQELIPNCSKVNKASMLQEAIEYVKTLQFQLQMMSMGSGALCMPQMVARGMQHFCMPTMSPFPAVGMGLGFGMRIHGMNSSCPIFPVPQVHAQQLACANSLAGTQAAGLLGPALMPQLPLDSLLALSMKANMASGSPLTQNADPMMTAVTSEDRRGKDLHADAVQKPN